MTLLDYIMKQHNEIQHMSEMGHSHRRKMNPHSVYSDRVRGSIWDLCLIFV